MTDMVATPSRLTLAPIKDAKGKTTNERRIRTFLWDNPELRRAFREAKDRENARRNEKTRS